MNISIYYIAVIYFLKIADTCFSSLSILRQSLRDTTQKISAGITQAVWRLGYRLAGWPSSRISIHGIFYYPEPITRFWGPTDHIFSTHRWIFPGLKRPGYKGDCSPPSSARMKNEWSYATAPTYSFIAFVGTNLSLSLR